MRLLNSPYIIFAILGVVSFLAFFKLGDQPLHEWDEAHTGINAVEMLQTGDYINLYHGGQPDRLRAKPPLLIWIVASCFNTLGWNNFSLRLPSALATIFIFFFLFKIITLYKTPSFALAVCLILISVRGIMGYHVGRTGDFDALLIALLLGGLYKFLRFFDSDDPYGVIWAGIFWGLAFFTKGPAMGVIFPGLAIYVLTSGRFKFLFNYRTFYYGVGICLTFPILWSITISLYGATFQNIPVSGNNVVERMFLYDLVDRFTSNNFEGEEVYRDWYFVFDTLNRNFKYWNYIFYLTVIGGIYHLIKYPRAMWSNPDHKLLWLSIWIWSTLSLFLSVVTATKIWYLAPAIPFFAITVVYGIEWASKRVPYMPVLFIAYFLLALYGRYFEAIPDEWKNEPIEIAVSNHKKIEDIQEIIHLGEINSQRLILEIYFTNPKVTFIENAAQLSKRNHPYLLLAPKDQKFKLWEYKVIGQDEHYFLLEKLAPSQLKVTKLPYTPRS